LIIEFYLFYKDEIVFEKYFKKDFIIYSLLIVILNSLFFLFFKGEVIPIAISLILIMVGHVLINVLAVILTHKFKVKEKYSFLIKHVLHILLIIIISTYSFNTTISLGFVYELISPIISPITATKYLLVFVVLFKPANIVFKEFLGHFKPNEDYIKKLEDEGIRVFESYTNAGGIIGLFERIIMMVALLTAQYALIGFVIAAKSIVRFKSSEITKFGEYYIIGTTYSVFYLLFDFCNVIIIIYEKVFL